MRCEVRDGRISSVTARDLDVPAQLRTIPPPFSSITARHPRHHAQLRTNQRHNKHNPSSDNGIEHTPNSITAASQQGHKPSDQNSGNKPTAPEFRSLRDAQRTKLGRSTQNPRIMIADNTPRNSSTPPRTATHTRRPDKPANQTRNDRTPHWATGHHRRGERASSTADGTSRRTGETEQQSGHFKRVHTTYP